MNRIERLVWSMNSLEQFEAAAKSAAATVERVAYSAKPLAEAVARMSAGAKGVAVAAPLDLPEELFRGVRNLPGVVSGRSLNELSGAEVGVTEAFAGVARTGSICVCVDHEFNGPISLLMRLHIAVLDAKRICDTPSDLLRRDCIDGAGLRRNFVFVTGPSATADMGPLVRGVHGPHRLHILILV